ncbi:MAG: hypothetical protein ACXAEU_06850 [Candidatus Hodarchaeales archaeon]
MIFTLVKYGIAKVSIDRSYRNEKSASSLEVELKYCIKLLETAANERSIPVNNFIRSVNQLSNRKKRILSEKIVNYVSTKILNLEQPNLSGLSLYVITELEMVTKILNSMTRDEILNMTGIGVRNREAKVNLRTKTPTGKGVKVTLTRYSSNLLRGIMHRSFDANSPVSRVAAKAAISLVIDIHCSDVEILYLDNQNNLIFFLDRTKNDGIGLPGVFSFGKVPGFATHKARSINNAAAVRFIKKITANSEVVRDFFHRTVKKPKQCKWDWYHMGEVGTSIWHVTAAAQKRNIKIKGYSLTDHIRINEQLARTFDMEEIYDLFNKIPLIEKDGDRWLEDGNGQKLYLIDYNSSGMSSSGGNVKSLITGTRRIELGQYLSYFRAFKESIKARYSDGISNIPNHKDISLTDFFRIIDSIIEDLIKKQYWVEFDAQTLRKLHQRIFGGSNRYFVPEFKRFALNLGGFNHKVAWFEFSIYSDLNSNMNPKDTLDFATTLQNWLMTAPGNTKPIRWNLTDLVDKDYSFLSELYDDLGNGVKATYINKKGQVIRSLGLGTENGFNRFLKRVALRAKEKGFEETDELLNVLSYGEVSDKGFYDFISRFGGTESKIVWRFLGNNTTLHLTENHEHTIRQYIGVMLEEIFRNRKNGKGGFIGINIFEDENTNGLVISINAIDFSLHKKYNPDDLKSLKKVLSEKMYGLFKKGKLCSIKGIRTQLESMSSIELISLYLLLSKFRKKYKL